MLLTTNHQLVRLLTQERLEEARRAHLAGSLPHRSLVAAARQAAGRELVFIQRYLGVLPAEASCTEAC